MNTGVRVHTDRASFDTWARSLSGLALPEELRPPEVGLSGTRPSGPEEQADPESTQSTPLAVVPVPPVVAASLALHGCAEVAITVRLSLPDNTVFGCFGLVGDLAAGLVSRGSEVEIGLFDLSELVAQVIRLVPPEPPLGAPGSVQITVLGADAAVAGWQQVLIGGQAQWYRQRADPHPAEPVAALHQELSEDLRLALADCLTPGSGRV